MTSTVYKIFLSRDFHYERVCMPGSTYEAEMKIYGNKVKKFINVGYNCMVRTYNNFV